MSSLTYTLSYLLTRYLLEVCQVLKTQYNSDIPDSVKELCKLKGKTQYSSVYTYSLQTTVKHRCGAKDGPSHNEHCLGEAGGDWCGHSCAQVGDCCHLQDQDQWLLAMKPLGQTVEKPNELSGKICPREVPREIRLFRGGQISRQFLRLFHCYSYFRLQKPKGTCPIGVVWYE